MLASSVVIFALIHALLAEPRITLNEGTLVGKTLNTRSGRDILAFQGVPFAAPPVGNLRFKSPQAVEKWDGELGAKAEGPECPQPRWKIMQALDMGQEDCLYLNVYTPKLEVEGEGLDVMVWVHGGGFFFGSGHSHMYGPQLLLDHEVILVTFNYRLGVLGFLSLGTTEAPGNLGLKDQVAALRWVRENIAKFGGNPNSVTVFGESAGGASINYLMLSPLARGLFHRAIAQSGSAMGPMWATPEAAAAQGRDVASYFGCDSQSSNKILECLRDLNVSSFVDLNFRPQWRMFLPTMEPTEADNAFLTEAPRSLLARGAVADVPLMAGLTTHEGLMYLGLIQSKNSSVEQEMNGDFVSYLKLVGITTNASDEAANEIKTYYQQLEPNNLTERFVYLKSDAGFLIGVDDLVRGVAALKRSPVFYYQFSYDGGRETLKTALRIQYNGTGHTDELGYMFSGSDYPTLESQNDITAVERVTKLWVNFAKTGNPTPNCELGVHWYSVESPLNEPTNATTRYLDIGENLVMIEESLSSERINFWQQLRQKYQQ